MKKKSSIMMIMNVKDGSIDGYGDIEFEQKIIFC